MVFGGFAPERGGVSRPQPEQVPSALSVRLLARLIEFLQAVHIHISSQPPVRSGDVAQPDRNEHPGIVPVRERQSGSILQRTPVRGQTAQSTGAELSGQCRLIPDSGL